MSTNKKRQLIGLLILIGLVMVVLAVSLPGLKMQFGENLYARQDVQQNEGFANTEIDPTSFDKFMSVFSTIVIILLILYLVTSLFSKDGRKRLLGMVGVFVVLVLMILVFKSTLYQPEDLALLAPPPAPESTLVVLEGENRTPVEFNPEPKSWLLTVMIVGAAVLVAVIIFSFINKIPNEVFADNSQLEEFAETAQSALADIEADIGDFDDIIIRCYAEMSRVLQTEASIHRVKAMTAFEFEQELVRYGFPAQPVHRLTRLFEQVRYGHQPSGETEKQTAVESLSELLTYIRRLDE